MKSFCALMAVFAVVWASGSVAAAQQVADASTSPTLVRIDGQLQTPTGDARTGSATIVVSLYAEKDDATPLWVEQQVVTLDAAGRYTVFAGATLPDGVPQEFLTGATPGHWLGVGAQGEAEQFRMMLVTVPYALKAREADTLAGKSATDFVLSENLGETVKAALKADIVKGANGTEPGTFAQTANFVQKWTGSVLTDSIIYDNGSAVGIGTATPTGKLDVAGTIRSSGLVIPTAGAGIELLYNAGGGIGSIDAFDRTAGIFKTLYLDGLPLILNVGSGGNVGIGAVPAAPLDVVGTIRSRGLGIPTSGAGIELLYNVGGGIGSIDAFDRTAGIFKTLYLDGSTLVFNVGSAGNVGIGTASPTQKLDVNGSINVSGNINAKYQDVAEWVETAAPLEAGTVVIVDPVNPNQVLTSPRAYDTRVAGAVSRQPGLILGERSDTKAMVAQSGRVIIKADAKYGAIKIGDLLVTSPTPGYAMRSRPMKVGGQSMHRPGTLLGKALEALPSGQGEILVLLTLQ